MISGNTCHSPFFPIYSVTFSRCTHKQQVERSPAITSRIITAPIPDAPVQLTRLPVVPPPDIMAASVLSRCRVALVSCRAARCSVLGGISGRSSTGHVGDHCILRGGSSYSALPEDYNCEVKLAQTSDAKTIVCYHPTVDIPYEHTKPIPRVDPLHNQEESHEQVLKGRLYETEGKQAPTMEELSKMFYTTKHRWYPVGQYHRRRMKKDHPKDR